MDFEDLFFFSIYLTLFLFCPCSYIQNSILSTSTARSRNSPLSESATLGQGIQNGKDRYPHTHKITKKGKCFLKARTTMQSFSFTHTSSY